METRPRLVSALLIVAFAGIGAIHVVTDQMPGGLDGAELGSLAIGVAGFALVPWRRRQPFLFGLLSVAVGFVSVLATYLPLIGVYTVATRRRPVEIGLVTGLSLAGAVVTLRLATPTVDAFLSLLFGAWVMILATTACGVLMGTQQELVRRLRERTEQAEAHQAARAEQARLAERRRIAGEMHDMLGHRLSLLSVHAGALELRADLPPETVRQTARVLRGATHDAMTDLREVVLVLREPVGELAGIDPQHESLETLPALVDEARSAGTPAELTITGRADGDTVPQPVSRTAYRVVREGLTNARRHAPGARVDVDVAVRAGRDVAVVVTSGAGQVEAAGPPGSGTGLIGLGERVVALTGGTLDHGPSPGPEGGYRLCARMPWRKEDPP